MIDDLALVAERLRDDLDDFKKRLRKQYKSKSKQVQSQRLKQEAASLAERGLVDLIGRPELIQCLGSDLVADLNVEFQRLLTASEKAVTRGAYDGPLNSVLRDYTTRVVVPLKQARASASSKVAPPPVPTSVESAFLGHSFDSKDTAVVECVKGTLESIGIAVVTGGRPQADRISEKVKRLIEQQPIFVGLYTRRDKVANKQEWTASPWVIDEKAYASAKRKKLVLIKENGITSIGGIQGDYEYIDFTRDELHVLPLRILQLFEVECQGFRE